jgi:hypothetical protein
MLQISRELVTRLFFFQGQITIFVNLGLFRHFETVTNIRTWIKSQILENIVRCKYIEAGVHIKNPIKNSYQDGLGRTTQTLDHFVGGPYINLRQEKVSN